MHLLGLRTTIYPAEDLVETTRLFRGILGIEPYFEEEFYVGFNVGGYELGLDPNANLDDGTQSYWGVDDIESAAEELIREGAEILAEVNEVGDGIKVAQFRLQDGNHFALIENPNFELD